MLYNYNKLKKMHFNVGIYIFLSIIRWNPNYFRDIIVSPY